MSGTVGGIVQIRDCWHYLFECGGDADADETIKKKKTWPWYCVACSRSMVSKVEFDEDVKMADAAQPTGTSNRCPLSIRLGSRREIPAQAKMCSGFVQCLLGEEEVMAWVGVWVEADDDLRSFNGVADSVVKRIAKILQ